MIRNHRSAVLGIAVLVCVLTVSGCTRSDDGYGPIEEYAHALSPDGEVSAYVYHYDSLSGGLTQVMLDFVGLGCGSGSAAWNNYDIGVELRWIDAGTLEVIHPGGKDYDHNASGDLLGCYDRGVRVIMVPRGVTKLAGRSYTAPIEREHTPSPDSEISAYTFRYDSPQGGITQVVVDFIEVRGCADSVVTFYNYEIDLQLNWLDAATLEVVYPDGQRFDHPPWGTTVRCVTQTVQGRMRPTIYPLIK